MKVSMLLMSYCPLPLLMWLVEKGLGRPAREMPCCKNTVKISACLCSKENRSLLEDAGSHPSGEPCVPLCAKISCPLLVQVKAAKVQPGPEQKKPPWFMCTTRPEDGNSSTWCCITIKGEVVWNIFPSSSPWDWLGKGTGGNTFLTLYPSALQDLYPLVQWKKVFVLGMLFKSPYFPRHFYHTLPIF